MGPYEAAWGRLVAREGSMTSRSARRSRAAPCKPHGWAACRTAYAYEEWENLYGLALVNFGCLTGAVIRRT